MHASDFKNKIRDDLAQLRRDGAYAEDCLKYVGNKLGAGPRGIMALLGFFTEIVGIPLRDALAIRESRYCGGRLAAQEFENEFASILDRALSVRR